MRSTRTGVRRVWLSVGILIGLGAGVVLGRSTSQDPVAALPDLTIASPSAPVQQAARQHAKHTPSPGADSSPVAEQRPADVSAADLVDALRAAAAGDAGVDVPAVVAKLNERDPKARVPLDVVLTLQRAGHSFRVDCFFEQFTDADLLTILSMAQNAHADDRVSWQMAEGAAILAASTREGVRRLQADVAMTQALLTHSVASVRRAGLQLAQPHDDLDQQVRAMATSDPDYRTRGDALLLYATWGSPGAIDLVQENMYHPSWLVSRSALSALGRLGEPGARVALEAFVSEGPSAFPGRTKEGMLCAVLNAGLGGELLTRAPRAEIHDAVLTTLESLVDENPDAFTSVFPHAPELLRTGDTERTSALFTAAVRAGERAWVMSHVERTGLPIAQRAAAFDAVSESSEEDVLYYELAERVVWDDTATLNMRTSALWDIVKRDGHRAEAYTLQLKVVRDPTVPPGLRASAVEQLAHVWPKDQLPERVEACRKIWHEVLREDPSAFVRAQAIERLGFESQ